MTGAVRASVVSCLRELYRLCRAAPLKSLRFRWAMRAVRCPVYLYPRVHFFAGRGARVSGGQPLRFGDRWPHGRWYDSQLLVGAGGTLQVDGFFRFYTGCSVVIGDGAILRLGHGYMNHHGSVECTREIRIGHGVFIGPRVSIRDADFHTLDPTKPAVAPIVIGDRVWIGEGVMILKGVTIGEGAVVAAGAVVARDVPARALVGGVPARVIRENVEWQ